MNKHHPFSPSVLERRELCPGSFLLEGRLPEAEAGKDAARGTLLHSLIAASLTGIEEHPLSTEDSEIVTKAVSFISNLRIKETAMRLCEHQTHFEENGNTLYSGTVDFVAVDKESKEAVIVDWKTGYGEVTEAENNLQGAAYALAIMQEFSVPHVAVYFFNPVLDKVSSHVFSSWMTIRDTIKRIISEAKKEDAALVPGEKQCKYCRAALQGACPALHHNLNAFTIKEAKEISIESMTDDELCAVFEKARQVEAICEAAEKEIRKRCEEEGSCGNYRVKVSSGGFSVDVQMAFLSLCKAENDWNLSSEKFLECCSVSVPKLKKTFAAESVEVFKTKKEAEMVALDRMQAYIQPKPDKKTLVKTNN